MKYCEKCRIKIVGDRRICPLCQGVLISSGGDDDKDEKQEEIFPSIPTLYRQYHLFFRLLIFLSIVAGVVSITVNLLVPGHGMWSIFVLAGIACLWISLALAIGKRRNIPKNLLYQVVILSVLSVLWDYFTGWRGWSIDYVVPILCVSAMATMGILSKVMKWDIADQMIYFCIDCFFGIIPIVFYFTGCLNVPYPSVICVAASVISLSALLVFQGENMVTELRRRLHM